MLSSLPQRAILAMNATPLPGKTNFRAYGVHSYKRNGSPWDFKSDGRSDVEELLAKDRGLLRTLVEAMTPLDTGK